MVNDEIEIEFEFEKNTYFNISHIAEKNKLSFKEQIEEIIMEFLEKE